MNQRTNKITIIGAGMAGLLAGNMLRRHDIRILEKKAELPDNHSALLRFRSTQVSDATGIPFTKVLVDKALWDGQDMFASATLAQANAYSLIVTNGELHPRSIKNMAPEERYLAPEDFVSQMAKNLHIEFNQDIIKPRYDHPVISTIPMPIMMDAVGWDSNPRFGFEPIWTLRARVVSPVSHVYQTIYSIKGLGSWYRATLHQDSLILEFVEEPPIFHNGDELTLAMDALKVFCGGRSQANFDIRDIAIKHQPFGKIMPIDEEERKKFILHLTDKWNIYSLGRFATWRPILLDHLVRDIKHIESMIASGCNYSRRLNTY